MPAAFGTAPDHREHQREHAAVDREIFLEMQKLVRAAKLGDLATHELFPPAPVLRDQTGVDQDLDVLLHSGEADRIQPAELADGALTIKSLRDDVAPCCIAEREEQPVGQLLALERTCNHLVVDYISGRRCQWGSDDCPGGCPWRPAAGL